MNLQSQDNALSKQLANTDFLSDLLTMMIDRGFGILPAREMAIETLALMLKHHPVWKNQTPSNYDLARTLRISPRKARGYLDEISFRNPDIDENILKVKLQNILKTGELIRDGSYVAIEIDDGLVREYTRQLVRDNLGIVEYGNTRSILKLSGEQYATLCLALLPEKDIRKVQDALDKQLSPSIPDLSSSKSLPARVIEKFMLAAGEQAGKKAVDLGLTLLTGGAFDVVEILKNLF